MLKIAPSVTRTSPPARQTGTPGIHASHTS